MSWKRKIAALVGADGAKIIVVIAVSRVSAQQSLSWLQSKKISGYPYWCFCSEDGESISGFDRFVSGATAAQIGQDLRKQWCALTIVSWTGEPGYTRLKLSPLLRPPFRFLFLNDSGDFFGPGLIPTHTLRRLREAFFNATHFAKDFSLASVEWVVRNSRQQLEFLGSLRVAGYWKAYHGLDWSRSALRHVWTPVSGNIRARMISIFAFFAQFSTPLSRSVFARFKGTRQVDLGLAPLRDLSYVEIVIYVRKWPFAEIKRTIARATESIVIFRQDGETADLQGLLELFRQPATFVVALQVQHTDWRKKLLSKYPFRQLQPGEVTRTLAPYSSLLAMRRDALMQFGVPEVLSSGSAYMLLCWQAAAAHLHSYTVGGTRQGGQEIDVPLEHAEFVKTLLDKKKLRILAPGDAALSRGNIATSPQHHRPFTGKPRVLVLSPYLPYPLSHGGAVRIFNLCRSLCSRVDFILVCFREAKDTVHYEILGAIFREVYVVDNDERNRDPGLPKQIPEYRNSAMRALVGHLCTTRAIDLLQIEYTQMAEYGECANVPVLLVEHDVTFTLYRQIWEAERSRRAEEHFERWIAFETNALKNVNGIWAMSSHDRNVIVEQGAAPETTFAVPNGVDLQRFTPRAKLDATPRVLFVGSFRHFPNLLAFETLRDQIMPKVWKAVPKAQLHVVAGPQHEHHARVARKQAVLVPDPRIVLEGFVEDVRPAYANADVVAIPLPVSAGTNIKLMESMACGRAVVSTPIGCVGLDLRDGIDLLIRPIEAGFADAIIQLLEDRDVRQSIAATARRTAESRFGWDAVAKDAIASYESLFQTCYQSPISFHHQTPTPIQSTR